MKKIIALLMLCLLLCAMSATAFAATVNLYEDIDYYGTTPVEQTVTGSTYTLPMYNSVFTLDANTEQFYGWYNGRDGFYYAEGETITVTDGMKIMGHVFQKGSLPYKIEYLPGNGTGSKRFIKPQENENSIKVLGIDSFFDFEAPMVDGKQQDFVGWMVKGTFGYESTIQPGEGVGWLFARAIADNSDEGVRYREEMVAPHTALKVGGSLTVTAVWGDNGNAGNDDNNGGGGGGGQGGGQGGNNAGGAAASNMPSTGDNSLRIDFLFVVMLVSLIGLRLMAKRRTN